MTMRFYCLVIAAALPCACHGAQKQQAAVKGGAEMRLSLTSTAFEGGGMIPRKHTCDGDDASPPLAWSSAPPGTKSFALICDDPDAPMGTWVHWVVFDIPSSVNGLPEHAPPLERLENGARQGMNDFHKTGYGGPCPPGGTHRYFFKLYALDLKLDLSGRVTKERLLKGMEGHILAEGQLIGSYRDVLRNTLGARAF